MMVDEHLGGLGPHRVVTLEDVRRLLGAVEELLPEPSAAFTLDVAGSGHPSASDADAPNLPVSVTPQQVTALLREVSRLYERAATERLAAAGPMLARFDGIPQPINILDIMRKGHSETAFCGVLAWLLDSEGSHGLGDAFVRHFLASVGITHRGLIMTSRKPLRSATSVEVSLPSSVVRTPDTDERRSGMVRIDVLLALDGLLIPIEAKVDASQTKLFVPGLKRHRNSDDQMLWQSAAYVAGLYRLWKASPPAGHASKAAPWDEHVVSRFGPLGKEALDRRNRGLRIRGVLLHLPGACDPALDRRPMERSFAPRHVNWLDVDAMLFHVLQAQRPREDVRFVLASFRTAVVAHIAEIATRDHDLDIPALLANLRVMHAHPRIVGKDPVRNHEIVAGLANSLTRTDACADSRDQPHREYAHEFES